jgi:DNA-binding transcriptional regulator PaaX
MKRKALLLLQAGVALSFAGTVPRQLRILEEVADEWKRMNRAYLYRIIREFEEEQLIRIEEDTDGTQTIVLSEKGKERVLTFRIHNLVIPVSEKWDGNWHAVFFDIPEHLNHVRDALRRKLKALGFYHWQKSVFVHPYPCRDQLDFVVTFFNVRHYVRQAVLTRITHESELLHYFKLQRP